MHAQTAFGALKQAMVSARVLRSPDFNREFTIETDALGGVGIGQSYFKKVIQ